MPLRREGALRGLAASAAQSACNVFVQAVARQLATWARNLQKRTEFLGGLANGLHAGGVHVRSHVGFKPNRRLDLKCVGQLGAQLKFVLNAFLKIGILMTAHYQAMAGKLRLFGKRQAFLK